MFKSPQQKLTRLNISLHPNYSIKKFENEFDEAARLLPERQKLIEKKFPTVKKNNGCIIWDINLDGTLTEIIVHKDEDGDICGLNIIGKFKLERNDRCPCDSELKYKKCHGAN